MWQGTVGCHTGPAVHAMAATDLMDLLLDEFEDVFATPTRLPPPRRFNHHRHLLPGTAPMAVRPYRYLQVVKDELERQCRDMLNQGIIHASSSTFSSSVLPVKKHDGSCHFCIDYHALSSKTVHDMYPIPVIDELRDAGFFTKLDLHNSYHQVQMHDVDIAKTAFCTHHGQFKFLIMPFGLTNAPATFQALMHDVLHDFLRKFALVFFDNILIYNDSWSSHL
jgi:hypothetical protein